MAYEEVLRTARERLVSLLSEDESTTPGWNAMQPAKVVGPNAVDVTGVTIYEREFAKATKPSNPSTRVGKARITIDAPPTSVVNVIWKVDTYRKWDVASVSDINLIETPDDHTQILHIKMRTLSAAQSKRDLCVVRRYEQFDDGNVFWVYAISCSHPKVPESNTEFVRAHLAINAFEVRGLAGGRSSSVVLINALDFTGWIHDKFVDADIQKNAQRLGKIRALSK